MEMLGITASDLPLILGTVRHARVPGRAAQRRQRARAGGDGPAPAEGPAEASLAVRHLGRIRVPADRDPARVRPAAVLAIQGGGRSLLALPGGRPFPVGRRGGGVDEVEAVRERLLGDRGLGRDGRHRVLDRLDPGGDGDGREPGASRRELEAGDRLPGRHPGHHHDAVRGRLLHHPARTVQRVGRGCVCPGGLDRAEADRQRAARLPA